MTARFSFSSRLIKLIKLFKKVTGAGSPYNPPLPPPPPLQCMHCLALHVYQKFCRLKVKVEYSFSLEVASTDM